MTRLLAVADIHLNLSKNQEWEKFRFNALFDYLAESTATYILILGDTFDKSNPSLKEIGLFYSNISKLKNKTVMIIDGNHEAIDKNTSVFDLIPSTNFKYYNALNIIKIEKVNLFMCGHKSLYRLDKVIKDGLPSKVNILLTHVRCSVPPHITEEIKLSPISDAFDYVVAGDIHALYKPFANFWYTHQPYSTKYVSKKAQHVVEININESDVSIVNVPVSFPSKVLLKAYPNNIPKLNNTDLFKIRVEGTFTELAELSDSNNIIFDKSVTNISSTVKSTYSKQGKVNLKDSILSILDGKIDSDSEMYGAEYLSKILKE